MNYIKRIEEYVDFLSHDETQTGGIKYILVFITNDGILHHNIGNELFVLADSYDNEYLTPKEALKIVLINQDSKIGAIYERKENSFELLVKEGISNGKAY